MSINDLIASAGGRLTPTERRIAGVVLEEPTQLAFGTVADLAERADTSRPSIVRFATKLGFEGYSDLQAWARDDVSRRLSSPSHRIRQHTQAPARLAIEEALARTLEVLDDSRLDALARPIARARRVWILSGETSMAGARVLHSGLSMIRPDVTLVGEHATGRELCGCAPGDVGIVLDFFRYRRSSITGAQALADAGVELVAITDGPLSPLATMTEAWCALQIPAVGPFDSAVPVVAGAELIVARVASMLGDGARERIDRLETLWQQVGTFMKYSPRHGRGDDGTG